jgi:Na+/H+ antiporter NhaD/arsenite permease-like protein
MLLYIAGVMRITPLPFLIAEIFASNVGGAATLIGDPPNIMIGSAAGLTFNEFLVNLAPIMVVNIVVVMGMLALIYRKELHVSPGEKGAIEKTFAELNEQEAIRDISLFKKSVAVIALVIGMFFIHDLLGLEPALVALIGASILLFWSRQPPEEIFEKIEWPALFFFGGLFIVVGALVETGTIAAVAGFVVESVHSEGEAMLIIAWFSAIASAVVDNIPLTATLIPLIHDMGASMNTYPLWWALSLGACLGGNGTAIGASANVVVLGIAARNGLTISFVEFLKVGMLVLFVTVGIGTAILWLNFFVL